MPFVCVGLALAVNQRESSSILCGVLAMTPFWPASMLYLPDTDAGFAHRSRLAPSVSPSVGRIVHHVPLVQVSDCPFTAAPVTLGRHPAASGFGVVSVLPPTVTGSQAELHHYYASSDTSPIMPWLRPLKALTFFSLSTVQASPVYWHRLPSHRPSSKGTIQLTSYRALPIFARLPLFAAEIKFALLLRHRVLPMRLLRPPPFEPVNATCPISDLLFPFVRVTPPFFQVARFAARRAIIKKGARRAPFIY